MNAKAHNDTMSHVFFNGLPRSLFESESKPEEAVTAVTVPAVRNPVVDIACEIEDLFIEIVDEWGDEGVRDRTPTLAEITPLARRLIELTADSIGATANVRQSVVDWLNSPRQKHRADSIRSVTKQLAKSVLEFPKLDKPIEDTGLPF